MDGSSLIQSIEQQTAFRGRQGGTTWFHPRVCMIPGTNGPIALMTLQSIMGSDVYGPVHWSESSDNGRTWGTPQPIPGWGRKQRTDGLEEGVCDVVPEYHAKTNTVLAIGHNVFYKDNVLAKTQPARAPVYVVRHTTGQWSEPKTLIWDDPRGSAIYTCGCGQRSTRPNGDILFPISFGPRGVTARSVGTLLCSFDGAELRVKSVSNELKNFVKRGLLEPSIAAWAGKYYMTIRAEDGRGYVCTSNDGLSWSEPISWCWDDGSALDMSTTQQHWLVHSEGLFLVYTRKAPENINVIRWRAPLYVAAVDPASLRLIHSSERIAVPMVGDGVKDPRNVAQLGNFHTNYVTPNESWVTVGEVMHEAGWRGDLLISRIRWGRPNKPQ
jgi:hypothetical protein